MLINPQESVLFIVDIQTRLAAAVDGAEAIIGRAQLLLKAADRLEVPVVVSEQYPQGLGHTDERLQPLPANAAVFPKVAFCAVGDDAIASHLQGLGRKQVLLAGMETHVCVLQTALSLKKQGYEVAVVADAVGSRHEERKALGLQRMAAHGVEIADSEMVVFEWLGQAGTPQFKELSRLIK